MSLAQGHFERAARLLAASEALLETFSTIRDTPDLIQYERDRDSLRARLDEKSLEAALAEGSAMEIEEAIAYALQEA